MEGALARQEPMPFDLLRREFASLFDRVFPLWPFEAAMEWEPPGLDLEEKENEVVVRAEVPGFELNELELTLHDNALTIRAEHREAPTEKTGERRHARLERTVTLPAGTEPNKIEARYRNGILEVHVPRAPGAKPRRIEVKT
jgi:HSP20 family protein